MVRWLITGVNKMKKTFFLIASLAISAIAFAQPATVCPSGQVARPNSNGAYSSSGYYDSKGNQCNTSSTTFHSGQNTWKAEAGGDVKVGDPRVTGEAGVKAAAGYEHQGEKTTTTIESRAKEQDCQKVEVRYDCDDKPRTYRLTPNR